MLGDQSTQTSSRQDRRSQNTYEVHPVEGQQRLPHSVQASATPPHDEHQHQDQLSAQNRAHHYTTNAPAVIYADTAHSAATVRSPPASAVPQPPARPSEAVLVAAIDTRFCPPGRGEPRSTLRVAPPPPARNQHHDERPEQQQNTQHREQPIDDLAAGGRGSFGAPPVGAVEDDAAYDDREATSAFYRNATFHRAAPGSAPSPLILTELPIEKFNGDIRRFPMFRDRFLEVVEGHPELAPRHKLQYLLEFLRGEPYQLANNFQLTDANYYIVINRLEEQYGDKYRLRQLLAQEFIAIRPPTDGVADLRRFHDDAFRITTELRTLGEDIEATVIYEHTLMGKLPLKLKEEIVRNSEYCRDKTVTSILDGLREYARVLDEVSNSGIRFEPPAPAAPTTPCRERLYSPPARSPSEGSTEESTECSEDANDEQPTTCVTVPRAFLTDIVKVLEAHRKCQFCGHPHVPEDCTAYTTVNQRLRRSQKLSLCPLCLRDGHRVDSCPRRGTDSCSHCGSGTHHQATCRSAFDGTRSEALRRNSKCATRGLKDDPASSDPKRHSRTTLGKRSVNREVTIVVATATKPRHSGTRHSPTNVVDNPNNRKKQSGNVGTRSQGRGSTSRPKTTSTDESTKQQDAEAYGNARLLAARPDLLQTDRCSTNHEAPQFDRARDRASSYASRDRDQDASGHELRDEHDSRHKSNGRCSNAPRRPSDANPKDYDWFPAYEEVRAYVAIASTDDAQAPLLECHEVTAANPTTGAARKGIVFFDTGSTFSYISPTLVRDLNLPNRGKCVRRVHTFGCPAPTTVEGFSTSVVLGAPRGHQVSLGAVTADFAIPSVRTALVEDADLPPLRRNAQSVSPTRITPDILIGQDRIHLFGRQQGSRLPAGYEVVYSVFGPTISGAPQVVTYQPKAALISCAAAAAYDSGPHPGSPRQQSSDTTDASAQQTIVLPSPAPSNRLTSPETESPTPKPDPALLAEQGLLVQPQQATDHPCLQNELQGDATSTTFCAERQSLPERMERSELLQRTPNPLDTELPLQSGPHTTFVVLKPELHLGQQRSAECNKQRDHRLPLLPQHPQLRSFDPPTTL